VVEGAPLLRAYTFTRIEGSNPFLSAMKLPRSVVNARPDKMQRQPPPPVAPPALDTVGALGVILHCQNRSCRHRAWLDPPSLKGLTTPDLERRAKCNSYGMRGCSAEVISPSSNSAIALESDTARAVRLRQWIQDHPVG
jgi:hypothetical protein